MIDDDEDLEGSALPPQINEPAVPIALTELTPWHTARKQFIREHQWLLYSDQLIRKLQESAAHRPDEIRYLCLPGRDYLDVELLAQKCRERRVTMTHTGFLAAGAGSPEHARAELRQQALVDAGLIGPQSETFWRRIEEVGHPGSEIERQVRERGPYHIINLDACGSIRPRKENQPSLIDALQQLIDMQIRRAGPRWLLLLTADVRPDTLHENARDGLIGAVLQNAAESDEFDEKAKAIFGEAEDLATSMQACSQEGGMAFVKLFSLGMGKWLLHLVQDHGWTVKMHAAYCYTTEGEAGQPTMPCLAFEFIRLDQPVNDAHGVSSQPIREARLPQEDNSIRAAEKTHALVDLDERMNAQPILRTQLSERLAEHLRRIGYTPEAIAPLRAGAQAAV